VADESVSRSIQKRDVPQALAEAILREAACCHYCGDLLLPRQVEHVRPLSRGGTNRRDNLVAACISCNTQKRAMLVHEWRQWREANGMAWPPAASHALDARHYGDMCTRCSSAWDSAKPWPPHYWTVVPHTLIHDGRSYVGRYRCPEGHVWKCWWGISKDYFSDCPCTWCVACRAEDGVETYPASPIYGAAA
jgi:RNase P subunit RPR2